MPSSRAVKGGGLLVGKQDNRVSFMDVTVIAIMAALVYLYVRNHYVEVKLVRSKVDDRTYLVRNLPSDQAAADLLATPMSERKKSTTTRGFPFYCPPRHSLR